MSMAAPAGALADSATRTLIEEGGTMNFFVVTADDELVTLELNGKILPGVSPGIRCSPAADHGLTLVERPLPWPRWSSRCVPVGFARRSPAGRRRLSVQWSPSTSSWTLTIGDGTPGPKTRERWAHLDLNPPAPKPTTGLAAARVG